MGFYLFTTLKNSVIKKKCSEEMLYNYLYEHRFVQYPLTSSSLRLFFRSRLELYYQICVDVGGPKKLKKIDNDLKNYEKEVQNN